MRVRSFSWKIAPFVILAVAALPLLTSAQTPRTETLLNGLKVLMLPNQSSDKVWVRVRVHSGSAFDPAGKEGVMQMLAANFFPTEAAREYFKDELGGSLDIVANYDYIQVDASAKPDSLIPMLETLSGGIVNTLIDKATANDLRTAQLAKVRQLSSDPNYIADRAAASRLFGSFPYGRPVLGTEESLKRIDFADLLDAKQRFVTADNATVIVSGNFQTSRTLQAVKRYFGGWAKADKKVPATFRQPEAPQASALTVTSPAADRFAIRVALRGTSRSAADYAAADVYARVLESRLKARVPAELASSVFVRNESDLLPGSIMIGFAGTKNDAGIGNGKIDVNELLPKILNDPISDSEFASARAASTSFWSKRSVEEFWLDKDTYNLTAQGSDRIFDDLTIAKVRDFAAWVARQPAATVLVNTPR